MVITRAWQAGDGAWVERLLDNATIAPRALKEFCRLNPDVSWMDSAAVLRGRLEHGHLRRRQGWQPQIELVTGTSVPMDYVEVVIRGRQAAAIRKDRLGESKVVTVRAIGCVRNRDPGWRRRKHEARQHAA